jgi:hypothetical protein
MFLLLLGSQLFLASLVLSAFPVASIPADSGVSAVVVVPAVDGVFAVASFPDYFVIDGLNLKQSIFMIRDARTEPYPTFKYDRMRRMEEFPTFFYFTFKALHRNGMDLALKIPILCQ